MLQNSVLPSWRAAGHLPLSLWLTIVKGAYLSGFPNRS